MVDGAAEADDCIGPGLQREGGSRAAYHPDGLDDWGKVRKVALRIGPGIGRGAVVRRKRAQAQAVQISDVFVVVVDNHILVALVGAFLWELGASAAIEFLDDQQTGQGAQQLHIQGYIGPGYQHFVQRTVEEVVAHAVPHRDAVQAVGNVGGHAAVLSGQKYINDFIGETFYPDGGAIAGAEACRVHGLYRDIVNILGGVGASYVHATCQEHGKGGQQDYNFILHVSP